MISSGSQRYFLRSRRDETTVLDERQDTPEHARSAMAATSQLKPEPFAGLPSQDANAWYTKFQAWLALNDWADQPAKVANGMRLLLLPPASTWFDSLDPNILGDVKQLDAAFKDRFVNSQPTWLLEQQLWSRTMQPTEGLDAYVVAIDSLCGRLSKPEADRITSFVRGLLPSLRPFVIQQDPKTFSAAVQAARLVQESFSMSTTSHSSPSIPVTTSATVNALTPMTSLVETVAQQAKEIQQLKDKLQSLSVQPAVVAAVHTSNVTCQLCQNTGHSATDCKLYFHRRANHEVSRRQTDRCSYCSRRGHLERDCFKKQRDRAQSQNRTQPQSHTGVDQPLN